MPESRKTTLATLLGASADCRWQNLGYWHDASDYVSACESLARLHATAVSLKEDDRLLEMACGQGAALAVWQNGFGITRYAGIDKSMSSITTFADFAPALKEHLLCNRFDQPLPGHLVNTFDTVICLDAAYHAQAADNFIRTVKSALIAGGRCAFTTLLVADTRHLSLFDRIACRFAGIPMGSRLTAPAMQDLLARHGFCDMRIEDLTQPVLAGFRRWVDKRAKILSGIDKRTLTWLKIGMTARWAKHMIDDGSWRYVMVTAKAMGDDAQ